MRPQKLKRAVVKEEFVALTDDILSALILNQFLYWLERVKDVDQYIIEERKRIQNREEEVNINKTHGWIYKSADEMKEEIMATVSTKTVKRRINDLIDRGWIKVRRNPNHDWDKTNQYRPDLIKINEDLMEKGYILQGYKFNLSKLIKNEKKESKKGGLATVSDRMDRMSDRGGHSVGSKEQFVHGVVDNFDENNKKPSGSPKSQNGQFDGSKGHSVGSNGQNDGAIPEIVEEDKEEHEDLHHLHLQIKELYVKVFKKNLNYIQEQELIKKIKQGIDQELIFEAVKIAAMNDAKSFRYIKTTLDDWIEKDITNVSDLEEYMGRKKDSALERGDKTKDRLYDVNYLKSKGWN